MQDHPRKTRSWVKTGVEPGSGSELLAEAAVDLSTFGKAGFEACW